MNGNELDMSTVEPLINRAIHDDNFLLEHELLSKFKHTDFEVLRTISYSYRYNVTMLLPIYVNFLFRDDFVKDIDDGLSDKNNKINNELSAFDTFTKYMKEICENDDNKKAVLAVMLARLANEFKYIDG